MAKLDQDMRGRDTLNFKTNRFCFCLAVFRSKLSSYRRLLFPLVTSRLMRTVEAGVHRILEATGSNIMYKSFCMQ